jgi:DASS family divalent anion:Na+ symporter
MTSPGAAADAGGFPRDVLVATLAGSPILSQCSPQDLARLVPFLRTRELEPGEALCRAGDPVSDLWLVLRGTLRLRRADDSSHEISDGLIGEEAALGFEHYLADVVAIGPATVAAFDKDLTPPTLRDHGSRAKAFCRSLIGAFAPTAVAPAPAAPADARLTPAIAAWKICGWIGAVVTPLALLRFFAGGSLRWEQQQLAAVLASAVMLWIFSAVAPYVAGLLIVMVCVTLGIVPTTVVLSGFASNGFFLALSMFCLGAVIIESGVIDRAFLMLMKLGPRSAVFQDLAALAAGFILTLVIASTQDRARVLAPLALESAQRLGYETGSRDTTRLLLSTFAGVAMFAPMFLTGAPLNLMLYGILPEQVQDGTTGLRWIVTTLPAAGVLLAMFLLAYRFMFGRAAKPRDARRTIDEQLALLGPVRAKEWLAVGGVVLFLGGVATVSATKIDHRLLALTVVCGYLVLGTLGKDQLNLRIDWSTLILLGTVIGLVATILAVDLHTAIGVRLVWLGDVIRFRPRLFVAMLAGSVVFGGLCIPRAGALIALITVPLAMFNGMNPWVVIFTILLMSDTWIFPYQSEGYRTFRDVVRSIGPFDDRLFLRFNAVMAAARVIALAASVVYWERLRVL